MKILIIGDLHIGARNSNPVLFKMMQNFFLNSLFPYIKENGIKAVLQLGDVHDRRKSIDFVIADWISKHFFQWFEDNGVAFAALVGNHDSYYKNTISVDGMSQLTRQFKMVKIIKEPSKLVFGGKTFVMLPWICDGNREACAKFAEENADPEAFLLGHFELAGFEMIRGFPSDTDSIDRNIVRRYRKVLSGHYHLTSEKGNVVYVGTPYELGWNDYGDRKRFFVYDTESDLLEEVPTNCTVHEKIAVSAGEPVQIPSCRGKFVKVVVEGDVKPRELEKILSSISESGAQTVQCISVADASDSEIRLADLNDPAAMVAEDIDLKWKNEPDKAALAKSIFKDMLKQAEEAMKQ